MNIGKINRISIVKNAYVSRLQHITPPPLTLFTTGNLPTERRPTVAIIGPRKPTAYGKMAAERFARELSKRGVVIVSGLAFGIDIIAHQATLDSGGTTIAVMAGGLHEIYPKSHASVARKIVQQGGAIISERSMGHEVRPYDFLARNRIISGLADAIFVPEATEKSGTLSTVTHALDQGVEVFALPGPITSPFSAGTNRLLQQGASVALRPEDILESIAPELLTSQIQSRLILGDTPLEATLITLLQDGATDTELLQQQSKAAPADYLEAMTMLELKGIVRADAGKWHLRY